ncbi:MAG TPA: NrpR regulatory domain-containing protein [Candidatus Hydrogenedens sp.]|nr:NrpR regulatory domain-containing protein [Candidatus Hydrogenedens sp.]HOK08803.1 NrpR regulatory domain-containing protein [Candidatus Hydrogenedens sp.]HOL18711.1 NrpR regulatory domain-containing protein [Candidatus Hydrogenedens sp.]HPP58492.1 NrpR regulatory domain-containing protein [Candidatus Hydrogenedens sp.]
MKSFQEIKVRRQLQAILQVLANHESPIGSERISEILRISGIELTDRAIRDYLILTDQLGWTVNYGRKGRKITEKGIRELETELVVDKVGFVSSKVEELAYRMDFDIKKGQGTIILNISYFGKEYLKKFIKKICMVYENNLGMGKLLTIADEKTRLGSFRVPEKHVAIGTICSVSLNGIFLRNSIPMTSRFGTLVELSDSKPKRFTQIISYEGTTIDPLEIFIRGKMTSVWEATQTGNGVIGVSFREIPSVSLTKAKELSREVEECMLGGILAIGSPNQPLLDMPVSQGRTGLLVLAGLNPIAVLAEHGIEVISKAMSTLFDYNSLIEYTEIEKYVRNHFW